MRQTDLHPDSNKAAAMAPSGHWLSYSAVPSLGADAWQKQAHTLCFRIPPSKAPQWTGDWKDSLIVFDER
jgi:hypothetical protein